MADARPGGCLGGGEGLTFHHFRANVVQVVDRRLHGALAHEGGSRPDRSEPDG